MKCPFIVLFVFIQLSSIFGQITWETPRTIDTPYSKYIRTCKIEHGPAAGDILLTYSDRKHGGNIWMMRSADLGLTWSEPIKLLQSPRIVDGEYIFNANIIQLADNRLMLCYQHRWDPGTIATKSYTGVRYSSDGGYTWTEEQKTPNTCVWEARPIQVHHDKNGDGHNDIYIYYTQEVNPTFFRPEHANQQYAVGRAVAYVVSYDNGVSWETNSDERFSGRIIHRNYNGNPDSQGGMPTMIELPNHRIAVVAEAPQGPSIAFASWVTASDPYDYDFDNIQGAWSSVNYNVNTNLASYDEDGYVIPSSITLMPDPHVYPTHPDNLWKMSNVYGNAPFACVLPNGYVAYSQNSNQQIRVFISNANGRNSFEIARPFSDAYRTFYSCIIPISHELVLITAHDYEDNSRIHINRGQIKKDTSLPTTPGTPYIKSTHGNKYTLEWVKSYDNILVSHYEVWNHDTLLTTTRWDNFVEIDTEHRTDYTIRVRARDYQGNHSPFSSVRNFTTNVQNVLQAKLKVHPTVVQDITHIQNKSITSHTVKVLSMLGTTYTKAIGRNGTVNLSDLSPGIYVLTLKEGTQTYTTKIIKK